MARTSMPIRRWNRSPYILSLCVDEVLRRAAKASHARFNAEIEGVRYCDLAAVLPRRPCGVCLPMYQKANSPKAPVYRVKFERPVHPGRTNTFRNSKVPQVKPMTRQTVEETLDDGGFTDIIMDHIKAGGSACVLGGAGTDNWAVCAKYGWRPKSNVCRSRAVDFREHPHVSSAGRRSTTSCINSATLQYVVPMLR